MGPLYRQFNSEVLADYEQSLTLRARYFREVYDSFGIKRRYSSYLDIGCGRGFNTLAFGKGIQKVIGIEKSAAELRQAKKRLSNGKLTFLSGDIARMPFPDKTFDLITAFSVIEHVDDLDRALGEIQRVLGDRGILVLQQPNNHFLVELHTYFPFVFFIPRAVRFPVLRSVGYAYDDIHATFLSLGALKNKLREHGFTIRVKKMVYPREIVPQKLYPCYRMLAPLGVFALIPFGYMLVCEKQ